MRKPDYIIGGPENPYLLRWFIIPRNKFFNIYLHKFLRDDIDEALHDHPWWSLSICLKGYLVEVDKRGRKEIKAGSFKLRSAKYAHRIEVKQHGWTIFITGPVIRSWGFHCPNGWVPWRKFVNEKDTGLKGSGCNG